VHKNDVFLPWHRSHLFYIEKLLQEADPPKMAKPATAAKDAFVRRFFAGYTAMWRRIPIMPATKRTTRTPVITARATTRRRAPSASRRRACSTWTNPC
jgi:hypothetical protein